MKDYRVNLKTDSQQCAWLYQRKIPHCSLLRTALTYLISNRRWRFSGDANLLTVFQENAILVPFDHHVRIADWYETTLEMCRVVFHQPRHWLHRSLELGWSWSFFLKHVLGRQLARLGVRRSGRCRRRSCWRLSVEHTSRKSEKLVSPTNI